MQGSAGSGELAADQQPEAVLWADAFSKDLSTASLFAIQDDIARNVARIVAQPYGIIFRDATRNRTRTPPALSDYDCVLEAYEYQRELSRESIWTGAIRARVGRHWGIPTVAAPEARHHDA